MVRNPIHRCPCQYICIFSVPLHDRFVSLRHRLVGLPNAYSEADAEAQVAARWAQEKKINARRHWQSASSKICARRVLSASSTTTLALLAVRRSIVRFPQCCNIMVAISHECSEMSCKRSSALREMQQWMWSRHRWDRYAAGVYYVDDRLLCAWTFLIVIFVVSWAYQGLLSCVYSPLRRQPSALGDCSRTRRARSERHRLLQIKNQKRSVQIEWLMNDNNTGSDKLWWILLSFSNRLFLQNKLLLLLLLVIIIIK